MKHKKLPILGWKLFWTLLAVSALSLAAHLVLYPSLPQQVPRQWSMDGAVNSWMDKATLPWLWALPAFFVLLFKVIPAIDPRSDSYRKSRKMWNIFSGCFTMAFVLFTWMTELYLWGPGALWQFVPGLLMAAVAVGLIALGNYMPRIRQNYTMGARTPWARGNCAPSSSSSSPRRSRASSRASSSASAASSARPWRSCLRQVRRSTSAILPGSCRRAARLRCICIR